MRADQRATIAASVAVGAAVAMATWGYVTDPDLRWLLAAGVLPALWGLLEVAQVRGDEETGRAIMTLIRGCVAWAGLLLAAKIGIGVAVKAGVLGGRGLCAEHRLSGLLLGAGMMLFGNYLPKLQSPWSLAEQPFAWQQVHRFVGWAFAVAGLVVFTGWAFLGEDAARRASIVVVTVAVALSLGRKLRSVVEQA